LTVPESHWSRFEPTEEGGAQPRDPAEASPPEIRAVPDSSAEQSTSNRHPGFGGTFVTDDAVLEGSLQFDGDRLVMWGGGNPLLSWAPGECLLERLTSNRFVLTADGETITFTADEPDALESAGAFPLHGRVSSPASRQSEAFPGQEEPALLPPTSEPSPFDGLESEPEPEAPAIITPPEDLAAARSRRRPYIKPLVAPPAEVDQEPEALIPGSEAFGVVPEPFVDKDLEVEDEEESGNTIADLAITRARGVTTVKARRWWTREVQEAGIKAGVVAAVVVVIAGAAFGLVTLLGGEGGEATATTENPTTSIVTVATTVPSTVATSVTVPPTTSVFALSGSDFAERWNLLASSLDESLLLTPNLTDPFAVVLTPYISFEGVLDPDSGSLRLRAAPTGTPEGDRAILVSLALVIGTAEPSLTPAQRGQLLEALGLDVRDPELGDLNGARTYNGRLFELVYLGEEGVLQFTVQPEHAVRTTSTTTSG
jgi:hypothetical protein